MGRRENCGNNWSNLEVKYARFNRYNRLMRIRATKRATILEHNMLAEYLNIVKVDSTQTIFLGIKTNL
jgi:hypothetical protein